MPNRNQILLPIRVVCFFLLTTLIMYYISPLDWPTENPVILFLYVLVCIISLYSGFLLGYSKYRNRNKIKLQKITSRAETYFLKYLNILLALSLIFTYPKFVIRIGQGFVGIPFIVDSIILGIASPEIAYLDKHSFGTGEFLSLSHPLVFSFFIISPLLYSIVPISIYLWQKLKVAQKLIVIIIIIMDCLVYISIGTNKGIFDYVILIPVILYLRNISLTNPRDYLIKKKTNWKIILTISLILFSLLYFTSSITGRRGKNFGYDSYTGKSIAPNASFRKILPEFAQNTYIALDYYLTQGYFALDKSFNLAFIPCYGLGHSYLLTNFGERVLGKNEITKRTYQYRLEDAINYSSSKRWHTFYVSLANDLSFVGVIFFIYLLGYWFSIVWMNALLKNNLIAVALIPLFMTMFFYFSSNNQVLGFEGQSFIFWVLLIAFFRSRK